MRRLLLAVMLVLATLDLILLGAVESALSIVSTLLSHILHMLTR